ncbi:hypothetical protein HMPREF1425_00232 [Helicobacter pylori GAM71Ai]|uniref:Uncharacterized protein n=1 Tax=Helicobacter pylori GAM260BSi TaxID=1159046 RepID=M3N4L9_HELPX|nr:hypothetical protein HMPREF1418_00950 [Helicobacter pylori GAM260BSi]EMH24515.1 hypothetical protein HMPREF1420_00925 [Helicobacter pylori GAM264Ai]EMH37411.1 hypothetical protein HMPREF1425_00232 [Helicobacter pylori GAM71Ai]EMH66279.1 hypothetical protein HMPREF1451_01528 [Helicobacter pylori HP260BFii]
MKTQQRFLHKKPSFDSFLFSCYPNLFNQMSVVGDLNAIF